MSKVVTVVGARPQFVKAAVLTRALRVRRDFIEVLVHTGQHHDPELSEVLFTELGIPAPDHHLGIAGGSHAEMTGRMLPALEAVIVAERPDLVVIFGDTNSTLAGALAASKLHVPLAHVEAGLRSYDRRMPEEVNRVVADHLSELLLCPTHTAVANLAAEGILEGVHHVGDVMYDAALHTAGQAQQRLSVLDALGVTGPFALLTVHRAENTEDAPRLRALLDYVRSEAHDMAVVFPMHPRTRAAVERFGISLDGWLTVPPVSYLDMVQLLQAAEVVFTDSGGLQKEAYFHRVPCVTLRETTEWVETLEAGWNRLWSQPTTTAPRRDIDDYGSGAAGERIAELLASRFA